MVHTVFALKWRPQNFSEIIGQDHIAITLKNALEKNRLAHAYLFSGPRGVGKTSTARILAKALNCKEGINGSPCGKCVSCTEITKGTSLDVIEIDGASNRQIDDIRTLRENVKFSPTQGKYKVYIIDEVHMLTTEAFNALLKTLEEPPEFVKFIFATTHPNKVPSTILSRCQRLDFRRIKAMEIVIQLRKIIKAEKLEVDEDVLFAIAKSSDGSLRDAESILDQLASFSRNKVSLKDVVSVLGLIEQDALFGITDKIIEKNPKAALEILNNIIDDGKDIGIFLNDLVEHFRNLMVAKITKADQKLIDLPEDTCQKLLKQADVFTLEEIFNFFNILVAAIDMGKRLDSLRVSLEITLVRLCHEKKGPGIQESATKNTHHLEKTHTKEAALKDSLRVEPAKKKEEPPVETEVKNFTEINITLEDIKTAWSGIIEALSKIKMSVATYFNEGLPLKLEKDILTVSFPKDYSLYKETLDKKENKTLIEKTIFDKLNNSIKLNFILSKEIVSKESQNSAFIKNAMDTFNGRLIKEG